MIKIQFVNAQVEDHGYGLHVNGKDLAEILSTALGTRVDGNYGYNSGLPSFKSACCNITITIDPQNAKETITMGENVWHSVKELEECKRERYSQKTKATEI